MSLKMPDLPDHLIHKILIYNIHPISEMLKNNVFGDYDLYDSLFQFYTNFFCSGWYKVGCWKCHRIIYDRWAIIACKNYCISCSKKLRSDEDEVHYSAMKLLNRKLSCNKASRRVRNWGAAFYVKK